MSGDQSDPGRVSGYAGGALTFRATLAFYIPLALSVTILGMTRTTLNAGMGRGSAGAGVQIGAFAAALGLSWILMAFVFPLREACLTFLRGPITSRQLRRLSLAVGIVSGSVGGVAFAGPWGLTILEYVMGLRGELRDVTRTTVLILCLSPPFFAWQRFNHGALLWLRATRPLTVISAGKYGLLVTAVVGLLMAGVQFTAPVAAWLLFLTDVAEGLLLELVVRRFRGGLRGPERPVSPGTFLRYFLPLAAREFITDCVPPVIAASMARLPDPEVALAAYGIAIGLNQIIQRPLFSFRHVAMALVRDAQSCTLVRRFSALSGWAMLGLVLAVTWSPAIRWLYRSVLGLDPVLLEPSVWATRIILIEVSLQPIRAFYQGILINHLRGWVLTSSTAVRLGAAFAVGFLAGPTLPLAGWAVGGLAYLLAAIGETLVVILPGRTAVRQVFTLRLTAVPGPTLLPGDAAAG